MQANHAVMALAPKLSNDIELMEETMQKTLVAVVVGLSVGAFASYASAQNAPSRDAVIKGCVAKAQASNPTPGGGTTAIDDPGVQQARLESYITCMKAAGMAP